MTGDWLTGCEADVVEGELANARVELEQEGERLADTTGGTEDGDLGRLQLAVSAEAPPASMAAMEVFARSKKLLDCLGAAEGAYLAGRHREGAALGLGESVPGSEHDGCDAVEEEMNSAGQCRWLMVEAREICHESITCQAVSAPPGRRLSAPLHRCRQQRVQPTAHHSSGA